MLVFHVSGQHHGVRYNGIRLSWQYHGSLWLELALCSYVSLFDAHFWDVIIVLIQTLCLRHQTLAKYWSLHDRRQVLKRTLTSIRQELITALNLATICPEPPVLDVHDLPHGLSKVITQSIFSQFHIMLDQYAWITLVCGCRLKTIYLILSSIEQKSVHGTGFHFYCPFSFRSVCETLALKFHVLLQFNGSI